MGIVITGRISWSVPVTGKVTSVPRFITWSGLKDPAGPGKKVIKYD